MSRELLASFVYEVEEGVELPLRVFGVKQPVVPAQKASWNDPGAPAEGGELEDLTIYSGARLEPDQEKRLLKDTHFLERLDGEVFNGSRWV